MGMSGRVLEPNGKGSRAEMSCCEMRHDATRQVGASSKGLPREGKSLRVRGDMVRDRMGSAEWSDGDETDEEGRE